MLFLHYAEPKCNALPGSPSVDATRAGETKEKNQPELCGSMHQLHVERFILKEFPIFV